MLTPTYRHKMKAQRRAILMEQHQARLISSHASWAAQMPELVRAYLHWKHGHVEAVNGPGALFEVTGVYTFGALHFILHSNCN